MFNLNVTRMQNISLSPHFELQEFLVSPTAEKYCIDNTPAPENVANLRSLCTYTLEPLREKMGLPIVITSGFRCKALNDIVSHRCHRSQHLQGQAADFYVGEGPVSGSKIQDSSDLKHETGESSLKPETPRQRLIRAFRLILTSEKIDYDQLILYRNFIHVSFVSHESNRHYIMKAEGNGRYARISKEVALSLV